MIKIFSGVEYGSMLEPASVQRLSMENIQW